MNNKDNVQSVVVYNDEAKEALVERLMEFFTEGVEDHTLTEPDHGHISKVGYSLALQSIKYLENVFSRRGSVPKDIGEFLAIVAMKLSIGSPTHMESRHWCSYVVEFLFNEDFEKCYAHYRESLLQSSIV